MGKAHPSVPLTQKWAHETAATTDKKPKRTHLLTTTSLFYPETQLENATPVVLVAWYGGIACVPWQLYGRPQV